MLRRINAPGGYLQGPGALSSLTDVIQMMQKKDAYLIVDAFIENLYHDEIVTGFMKAEMPYQLAVFGGECSWQELHLHQAAGEKNDVIIGIGGGKTLDVAKAVASSLAKPVIIVPTSASSDAPCSQLAVIYTEQGTLERYLHLPHNPDWVIVDSTIIAKAPVRLLVAGIGDALSTYYEACACQASHLHQVQGARIVYQMAKQCLETLLSQGIKAIEAVKDGICNDALEDVIEANIYLSGIGFESGGLAAAHAIHNGLTLLEETSVYLHGEKVAFGTLVQLALEQRSDEDILTLMTFCHQIGLPISLADIGLTEASDEHLLRAAKASCQDEAMGHMPFAVRPEDVLSAIHRIDALARPFNKPSC